MDEVQFPHLRAVGSHFSKGHFGIPACCYQVWLRDGFFFPCKNFQGFVKDFSFKWAFEIQILERSEKPHSYKLIKIDYLNLYFLCSDLL